jgi:Leucine-rich repeat (LRR) protein
MNILVKSTLLLTVLSTLALSARVKDDNIETSIISLPKISLENIDYNGLSISYAVGDIEITNTIIQTEEIPCMEKNSKKAMLVKTDYYLVEYKRPPLVIVVKDRTGKVVYADKVSLSENAKTTFGKGECRFWLPGALEKAYSTEKDLFLKNVQTSEIKETKAIAKEIINNTIFARFAEEEFKLYYVTDKEGKYSDIDEAYQIANAVYTTCSQSGGYTQNQVYPLKNAIDIWNKALLESNLSDKKARINHEITMKLNENIAIAYLFLGDYEAALTLFTKIKSLEKFSVTSSSKSHFSQVRARALNRMTGVNINNSTLSDPDKLTKALALTAQFSSKISITDQQKNFAALDNDFSQYKTIENNTDMNYAANAEKKAIENGTLNPYESEVAYSAMQGYFYMKTPLMALGTKYDAIPVELCSVERLNQLIITHNNVSKIPKEVGKLKNLKVLDLKDNKLTLVPEELSQLASLEKLDLSENQITRLPASIGNLSNLSTLNLKKNPLSNEEISRIMAALPKCKVKF